MTAAADITIYTRAELEATTKQNLLENLLKRSTTNYGEYEKTVDSIIQNVKQNKEEAIFDYNLKFDKCTITKENFQVTQEEIEDAYTDGEITGSAYDNLIYLVDELI